MDMLPPKERMCHCAWFEKNCRELVASGACGRWSSLRGMDPQTGQEIDRWGCTDDHIPTLLMSIGKLTLESGAATEQLRDAVIGARQERQRHQRGAIAAPDSPALPPSEAAE
jgi:hypothetical protein